MLLFGLLVLMKKKEIKTHEREKAGDIYHNIIRTGAVVHDLTLPLCDFEAAFPGVLADAVKGDVDALTVGEFEDLLDPAGAGGCLVVDDMGRTVLLCQLGLLGPTGGSDDGGAQIAKQLTEEKAHAAGCGVDQDRLALLHGVRLLDQRQGGHAHEEAAHGVLVGDGVGDLDDSVCRHGAVLGVSTASHPDDTVALLEPQRVVPLYLCDRARRFLPNHQGQPPGRWVQARPEVRVNIVDPCEVVLHQNLPV